ncbi:MAG: FMN-binding protein [Oscillospiraceae bacterium]|nr:FMN-binding protein [Oscillospiraceae bacterium]
MQKILPSLVLMLVCAVVCGLLAAANAVTKDKIAQAEAEKVQKSLTAVFGEDTYTELENTAEDITAVYENSKGMLIFDVTADGYAKGGIRALIGINPDGTVASVGIVSLSETPGLGTKINDPAYLSKYTGIVGVKEAPDAISGATYSSKGLKRAVDTALTAFAQQKEVQ